MVGRVRRPPASVRVLHPGLLTTVQDLGRRGYQRYGVTVGGAMDPFALRVANLLVGNEEGAAALESTLIGPALRIEREALLAICGGDLGPEIDGIPVAGWRPVRVRSGATLSFRGAVSGCRAYVAFAGGIDVPLVLGSRSTHLRAAFGGLDGRALGEDDVLRLGQASPAAKRLLEGLEGLATRGAPCAAPHWSVAGARLAGYRADPLLRLMRGPEFERLTPPARARLYGEAFRISPASDRMGYRLAGPRLELATTAELISEGVTAGTLQLPSGGSPIALMADRQTTGGYPRIGQIATVDLPVVAQLKPGDGVRFGEISVREAQALLVDRERTMAQIRAAVRVSNR